MSITENVLSRSDNKNVFIHHNDVYIMYIIIYTSLKTFRKYFYMFLAYIICYAKIIPNINLEIELFKINLSYQT